MYKTYQNRSKVIITDCRYSCVCSNLFLIGKKKTKTQLGISIEDWPKCLYMCDKPIERMEATTEMNFVGKNYAKDKILIIILHYGP